MQQSQQGSKVTTDFQMASGSLLLTNAKMVASIYEASNHQKGSLSNKVHSAAKLTAAFFNVLYKCRTTHLLYSQLPVGNI